MSQLPDDQIAERWKVLAERSQSVVKDFLDRQMKEAQGEQFQLIDYQDLGKAFMRFQQSLMQHPEALVEAQTTMMQQSMQLWQSTMNRFMGQQAEPVAVPGPGDRRFKDPAWSEQAVFDYVKQSYLIASRYIRDVVSHTDDLDPETHDKIAFYTRQFLSAASPSNFALTNPQVLRRAEETEGESLFAGLKHLLDDLERGRGKLKIAMTQDEAFEVGANLAVTEGAVIYQNELIQLIQYSPRTETQHKIPFLITPPWINKFYILDLQPRNSFVQWLLDQGHTVFLISWVNATANHREKSFTDYMKQGPLAAMDVVEQVTGEKTVNVLGFCIGGILISATLAYLAARGDKRVKSATLLASMIDFQDVGEVSVFVDDKQLARIKAYLAEHGYLDGQHMADMFSMMRENDLIWSFVVNNYLLGREPMPFDLLYWNANSTRLPARMLTEYLERFYIQNGLAKPGHITLDGTAIDLSKIKTPTFALGTKDDHIAPWQSCFPVTKHFGGPVRFVLGGSGHIAGIVNPPNRIKYGYWTGTKKATPESWLAKAAYHEGSWWPEWGKWLKRHAGPKVPARDPNDGPLPVIEAAPGSYVKAK